MTAPTRATVSATHEGAVPVGRTWLLGRVAFDPPLRDPRVRSCCPITVSCRQCGQVMGRASDPIDALVMAWRSRSHLRGHATA